MRPFVRLLCCLPAVVALLYPGPAAAAEPGPAHPEQGVLLLGNAHYPPFIYQEGGRPTGLVADLARAVLEQGGITGRFEAREWQQAQADVRAGRADGLVLINRNPERDAYLDFSAPLISSSFVFFRRSDRADITGPDSLQHRIVGVERGGYTTSIMTRFPAMERREIDNLRQGFDLLARGEIDALITERWAGMYELSQRSMAGIAVIEQPVDSSMSYIAVRKGNPALLEKINRGLDRIERDGTRQAILDRWSGKQVLYVTRDTIDYYRLTQWLAGAVILLLSFIYIYSRKLARLKREAIEAQNAELEQRVATRTRELLTARAEAERATASRTQFMANVSDRMRNPLQGILGFAAIGRQRLTRRGEAALAENAERLAECFDRIAESGQRMNQLVDAMITVADKSWKERLVYSDNYVDSLQLDTLVAECLETQREAAQQRGQELRIESAATVNTIAGDAVRLRQVLQQLVGNAIRYAPPGTTITLSTRDATLPPDGRGGDATRAIALEVIDQGPGIPAAELEEIFQPFYRGSHTASGEGTAGLGLAICRTIVEQHGGRLRAANRAEGGAVFEVVLPCAATPPVVTDNAAPAAGLAEPDAARREYLKCTQALLRQAGHPTSSQRVLSPEHCPLGQWLSGPGLPFSLFQEFHDVSALHRKLHEIADRAAELTGAGQEAEAQRLMEADFAATSRQIAPLLDALRID